MHFTENVTYSVIEGIAFGIAASGYDHDNILSLAGTNTGNAIRIGYSPDSLAAGELPVTGAVIGNDVRVAKAGSSDVSPAFAASFTPDPYLYETARITLTGNITINNPTYKHRGQMLRFALTQDGTGGRTTTFGSAFKKNWTPVTTAGKTNVITFECDGTNWIQVVSAAAF